MNATSFLGEGSRPTNSNEPASSSAYLSTDVLLKALEEAKQNEARLKRNIEEMQRRLVTTQEEATILAKLIGLRNGETREEPTNATLHTLQPPSASIFGKSRHNALVAVVAILEEANRPVHISDLMRLLDEQNVRVPGSGTQANLISHLRRDERIVRPSRGMYGLSAWGLTEMANQAKRRRRRRRSN